MTLKIYNTLTRKTEEFVTLEPGKVRMYVCGPTVYNKAHVGHAMSAVVFDIIRRYLEYRGYQVTHAMNFTDVDDKIINRANERGVDPFALAQQYIDEFDRNLGDMNVETATLKPRATREIPQIVALVQKLIDTGYAYPVDGDVYFRVLKDPEYGKLIQWFDSRNHDELADDMPLAAYTRELERVKGLRELTRRHIGELDETHELPSLMEFVLDGLHQNSKIAKDEVDHVTSYKDLVGSIFAGQGKLYEED